MGCMIDGALNDEYVTNDAIFTVFWSLGLPKELCYNLVFQRWKDYAGLIKFEEMRHHELSGHYPEIYRQRKYLG